MQFEGWYGCIKFPFNSFKANAPEATVPWMAPFRRVRQPGTFVRDELTPQDWLMLHTVLMNGCFIESISVVSNALIVFKILISDSVR